MEQLKQLTQIQRTLRLQRLRKKLQVLLRQRQVQPFQVQEQAQAQPTTKLIKNMSHKN